jgi:hypothetical protein
MMRWDFEEALTSLRMKYNYSRSLHVASVFCPSDDRFRRNVFTTFDSHVVWQSTTHS